MPILSATLNNSALAILIGMIVVFAYIAFWFRYKYLQKVDELLEIADKDDFFSKKPSIMRADERKLFDVLTKLYSDSYYVYPQVKLTSLLDIKEKVKDHDNVYRTLDYKSVDFALFDRINLAPVLAIELNGSSHFAFNRINRDKKVESILTKAGIKFLAITISNTYNEDELRQTIGNLLNIPSAT